MNLLELKEQIMKNKLSNFYIFTGIELGIMKIYLQQMSNKLNLPITRTDSVLSIYDKCQGNSLFGNDIGFYVIREDKDFQKQEKLFDTIKTDIRNNVIVLLYEKIDSRLKFGKHFKDDIVAFEKLTPNVLKSYIQKEIPLSDKNTETLMELCNGSYDLCMLEIDKIKQYTDYVVNSWTQEEPIAFDDNSSFLELLECGVIYQPEETDVFKFTEAVCKHNTKLAFHLEQVLRNTTPAINILGTLYNTLKNVLLIQCCQGSNISEITGLDNRQIYYSKQYKGIYTTGNLVRNIKLINKTIDGIKNGLIDDEYATRYILSNIML